MDEIAGAYPVRVLPFRVRPLPDEPLDSWLEAMAASNLATIGETACALGLIAPKDSATSSATRWRVHAWSTALSMSEARQLEATTGINAAQFHEMTRLVFARHAIRRTRSGRISAGSAVGHGTGGRYCPSCLLDSGGRWRMSRLFSFGFACPRHRCLLVDTCPDCGHPPRRLDHPLAMVPAPGKCHNRVGEIRGRTTNLCRADLSSVSSLSRASESVLATQRRLMQIVSSGEVGFGIYEGARQPAVRVLEDVRVISHVAARIAATGGEVHVDGLDCALPDAATGDVGHAVVETAWTSAVAVAALKAPGQLLELLRGNLSGSSSYTLCSPQLQSLIAASFGRARRPTAFLQSALLTERDPAERARKVPAQMWPEWIARFAPARVGREISATALSAAVVFAGTCLTHSAALALIDPSAPVRQVTHVMRVLGRAGHRPETIRAILRLADYLDSHDLPIDYARRRALDCRGLLPEDRWIRICAEANAMAGREYRWRCARAFLYYKLTGNSPRHMDEKVASADVVNFDGALPTDVRRAVEKVGREFLAAAGIREPLTWSPPFEDFKVEPEPDPHGERLWSTARPAFSAAGRVLPHREISTTHRCYRWRPSL